MSWDDDDNTGWDQQQQEEERRQREEDAIRDARIAHEELDKALAELGFRGQPWRFR